MRTSGARTIIEGWTTAASSTGSTTTLSDTWIEDWDRAWPCRRSRDYLAKHLAFLSFLDEASA